MPSETWSCSVSAAKARKVQLGGAQGVLELRSCVLASGDSGTLYCQVGSGVRLALGKLSGDRRSCAIGGRFCEAATFSSDGGEILLNGLLKRSASEVAADVAAGPPPAKKARSAAPEAAAASPVAANPKPAVDKAAKASPASAPVKAAVSAPAKAPAAAPAKAQTAAPAAGQPLKASRPPTQKEFADAQAKVLAQTRAQQQQQQSKQAAKPDEKSGGATGQLKQLRGGLAYELLRSGSGPAARPGRTVQVRYDGRLAKNGKRFDKGVIKFRLGVGEVIKGWDEGVNGMTRGEKRRLRIPSKMGYGPRGAPPDIPANADLVFEVELLQC